MMGRSFGGVVEGAKLAYRKKRKEGQPDRRLGYLFIYYTLQRFSIAKIQSSLNE